MTLTNQKGELLEMVAGLLEVDLYIAASRTLKDKRRVIQSLIARTRNKFNVSVAEVGNQDKKQLATLGVALASNDVGHTSNVLESLERFMDSQTDVEVVQVYRQII